MSSSTKVFIYNGPGTSAGSVTDLTTLFSSNNIFPTRPDVAVCQFEFNVDGLTNPTWVTPGGSTTIIGPELKSQMDKIKDSLGMRFNFMGVCAGGFVGTEAAGLCRAPHTYNYATQRYQAPTYVISTEECAANNGLITDYLALGPFYPHHGYVGLERQNYMPYRVSLSIPGSTEKLSQLYVAGPGFVPLENKEEKSQTEVVGVYADREAYRFSLEENFEDEYKNVAAIIRKRPDEKSGGVLLTGPHIEACVPKSTFLSFFKTKSKDCAALSSEDYGLLLQEQEKNQRFVESLLKETFNPAASVKRVI